MSVYLSTHADTYGSKLVLKADMSNPRADHGAIHLKVKEGSDTKLEMTMFTHDPIYSQVLMACINEVTAHFEGTSWSGRIEHHIAKAYEVFDAKEG